MHIRTTQKHDLATSAQRWGLLSVGLLLSVLGGCSGNDSGSVSVNGVTITNANETLVSARSTLEAFRSINSATLANNSDCWIPVQVQNGTQGVPPQVAVTVWCGPVGTPLGGSGWLKGTEAGNASSDAKHPKYSIAAAQYNVAFTTEHPQIPEDATVLGVGKPPVDELAPVAPIPAGWVVVGGIRVSNSDELFAQLDQKFAEVASTNGASSPDDASCWLSEDAQNPNAFCGPVKLADDSASTAPFIQFPLTFEPNTASTARAIVNEGGYNRAQPDAVLISRTGAKVGPPAVGPGGTSSTTPGTTDSSSTTTPDPNVAPINLTAAPGTIPWAVPSGPAVITFYSKVMNGERLVGVDPSGTVNLEHWLRTPRLDAAGEAPAIDPAPGFELVAADVAVTTDELGAPVKLYLDVDGQRTPIDSNLAEAGFVAAVPKTAASVTLAIDDGLAVQRFDLRSGVRVNDGNPAWYRAKTDVGLLTFTTAGTTVPLARGTESWLITLVTEHAFVSGFDAKGKVVDPASSDLVVVGRYEAGTSNAPIATVGVAVESSYRLTLPDGTELTPYAVTGDASRFRAYFHVPAAFENAQLAAQVVAQWSVADQAMATPESTGSSPVGEPSLMQLDYGSAKPVE